MSLFIWDTFWLSPFSNWLKIVCALHIKRWMWIWLLQTHLLNGKSQLDVWHVHKSIFHNKCMSMDMDGRVSSSGRWRDKKLRFDSCHNQFDLSLLLIMLVEFMRTAHHGSTHYVIVKSLSRKMLRIMWYWVWKRKIIFILVGTIFYSWSLFYWKRSGIEVSSI